MAWSDVAQLVGRDVLERFDLADHRPDCKAVPAGLLPRHILGLGQALTDPTARKPEHILAEYVTAVPRDQVATQLGCPLYVAGEQPLVPHPEYHRLLDLHADPATWRAYLKELRDARRVERELHTSIQSVLNASIVGRRAAEATLELASWELDLAFSAGLLTRVDPGSGVLVEGVTAALDDLPEFKRKLKRHESVNANDAAAVLGIPRTHFNELVDAGLVTSCGTGTFKWGTFHLYRRGELDDLLEQIPTLVAERKQLISERRKRAAKTAVVSRAKNKEVAALARVATQNELLDIMNTDTDPLERSLGMVAYWTTLVGGHADQALTKAVRARRSMTTEAAQVVAKDCYAAKNEALAALAQVYDPRLVWSFYDAGRLWLCDECMFDARELGIHPAEYKQDTWCNHCELTHHYSVLTAEVRATGRVWEMTVPVPLAAKFPSPKNPPVRLGVSSKQAANRSKPPPWRKLHRDPFEKLPAWIQRIKDSRQYDLRDLAPTRPLPTSMLGQSPDDAVASLRAAIATLRELLAEAATHPPRG